MYFYHMFVCELFTIEKLRKRITNRSRCMQARSVYSPN